MSSHSAAAAPVLRTERLSKSFHVPQPWPRASRPLFAVNEVSLTLPAGRTLGIVGESGVREIDAVSVACRDVTAE